VEVDRSLRLPSILLILALYPIYGLIHSYALLYFQSYIIKPEEADLATVPIDESTRLVTIRFRFSNPSAIPEALRQRMIAPKTGPVARSRGSSIVIEATENVSLDEFFRELEAAGYVLVDGFYVVQPNSENAAKTQHLVRFTFCRLEHAVSSDHFKRVQPHIQAGLQYICNAAFWRTTAYSNPFTKNDEEVAAGRVPCLAASQGPGHQEADRRSCSPGSHLSPLDSGRHRDARRLAERPRL
jgi:hypothetical protein